MAFYDVSPGETASQGIGKSIGQSIGAGLQQMAQEKVSERLRALEAKRTAAGLEAIMKNATPEQRMAFANMPTELQKVIIPQLAKMQQQEGVNALYGDYFGTAPTGAPMGEPGAQQVAGGAVGAPAEISRGTQITAPIEEKLPVGIPLEAEIARKKNAIQKASSLGHNETAMKMQTQLDNEIKTRTDWLDKKAAAEVRNQEKIDTKYAPIIKETERQGEVAGEVLNVLEEMERILKSGEAGSGPWAANAPTWLTGAATQRLNQLQSQFVELMAKKDVKGVVSKSRLENIQKAKMSTAQDPEVQLKIVRSYKKDFEKPFQKAQIQKRILGEREDVVSPNLSSMINREMDAWEKESKNRPKESEKLVLTLPEGYMLGEEFDEMPDPRTYKYDTIKNPDGITMKKNADKTKWIEA